MNEFQKHNFVIIVRKCDNYLKDKILKGIIKYILAVLKTLANCPKPINAPTVY